MGLLDDVMKSVGGAAPAAEGTQSSLASAVLSMLSNQGGGISGLLQQCTATGLGSVCSSWIGTGQNLPISAEQIENVLGSEQVQAIAAKVGVSPEAAKSALAMVLPQVVDHLTPNGEVPQGDLMSKGMELLKGRLFA